MLLVAPLYHKNVRPDFNVCLYFLPSLRLKVTIGWGRFTGLLARLLLLSKFSSLQTTSFTWLEFILVLTMWSISLNLLFYLSFTNEWGGRVSIVRFTGDGTVISDQGIIFFFIDLLDFVQLLKDTGILWLIENSIVLLLWCLNMLWIFFSVLQNFLTAALRLDRRPPKYFLLLE